jgi:hypothetical protein
VGPVAVLVAKITMQVQRDEMNAGADALLPERRDEAGAVNLKVFEVQTDRVKVCQAC